MTTLKSSPDLHDGGAPDLAGRSLRHRLSAQLRHAQGRDVLARIPGVGEVRVFGAGDYAMRVWLDPEKMAARGLTASDVVRAIREQNVQVAAGVVGAAGGYRTSIPAHRQCHGAGSITEEEFGDIVVKTGATAR